MTPLAQNIVFGSLGIAGLMAVLCIIDIAAGFPFGGQTTFDVLFIIVAGMTGYMGWDTLKK